MSLPSQRSISQRWFSFATNLLLTGVILIAGLVFGRYVIRSLWATPESRANHAANVVGSTELGDARSLHALEFGETRGAFYRQQISGDFEAVTAALRQQTVELTQTKTLEDNSADAAQLKWLNTGNQKPVASGNGWRVFQPAGPLPVAVGIRTKDDKNEDKESVACWSLAMPAAVASKDKSPSKWTLFSFLPSEAEERSEDAARLPLPAGTQRILSLSVSDAGPSIQGFIGEIPPNEIQQFFDELSTQRKWTASGSWREQNQTWNRLFTTKENETIHIAFSLQSDGTTNGLMMRVPAEQ